jgi:hypothetical protein
MRALTGHRSGTVAVVDDRIAVLIQGRWYWMNGDWMTASAGKAVHVLGHITDLEQKKKRRWRIK